MKETDKEEQVPMEFRGHKIKYRDLPKEEKVAKVFDVIGFFIALTALLGLFGGNHTLLNIGGTAILVSEIIYIFSNWEQINKEELVVAIVIIIAITAIYSYMALTTNDSRPFLATIWHALMFAIVFFEAVITCVKSAY